MSVLEATVKYRMCARHFAGALALPPNKQMLFEIQVYHHTLECDFRNLACVDTLFASKCCVRELASTGRLQQLEHAM